jgi:glyoxylase-like metal-dependent hydrolase (beta-lactamase superfamily II)
MIVECLTVGPLMENCYILGDEKTGKAAVIDPGDEPERIVEKLNRKRLNCEYILLTHAHVDHVSGIKGVVEATGAKVLIHKGDAFMLKSAPVQALAFGMKPFMPPKIEKYIEDGDIIEIGNLKVKVLHTPGHSSGGVCFLVENCIFVGDTIFQGSIGRTDLPGGDYNELIASVEAKIFTLPDDTVIYPGHGPETTVGYEKKYNPFF